MPLYFFWGEEDYLIEKEVKTLKKRFWAIVLMRLTTERLITLILQSLMRRSGAPLCFSGMFYML